MNLKSPNVTIGKPLNPMSGEMAVDASGNLLVYEKDSGKWVDVSNQAIADTYENAELWNTPREKKRAEAQAYLESLGIKEDIDSILKVKYPEHLI